MLPVTVCLAALSLSALTAQNVNPPAVVEPAAELVNHDHHQHEGHVDLVQSAGA